MSDIISYFVSMLKLVEMAVGIDGDEGLDSSDPDDSLDNSDTAEALLTFSYDTITILHSLDATRQY